MHIPRHLGSFWFDRSDLKPDCDQPCPSCPFLGTEPDGEPTSPRISGTGPARPMVSADVAIRIDATEAILFPADFRQTR